MMSEELGFYWKKKKASKQTKTLGSVLPSSLCSQAVPLKKCVLPSTGSDKRLHHVLCCFWKSRKKIKFCGVSKLQRVWLLPLISAPRINLWTIVVFSHHLSVPSLSINLGFSKSVYRVKLRFRECDSGTTGAGMHVRPKDLPARLFAFNIGTDLLMDTGSFKFTILFLCV